MSLRSMGLPFGFLVACAVVQPACAQQPPAAPGDLQKQVDDLRRQVGAMQKDLDEIKTLLAPLRNALQGPQVREGALLDLGNRPVKGAPTAKVTLVELTDYQ